MDESSIEIYYEIITLVLDHMEMLAMTAGFCLLCRGFLREKKHIWITGFVYFMALFMQYHIPFYMGGMIANAAAGISALFCMIFLERRPEKTGCYIAVKVYLVCIFYSVNDLATGIALELYVLINSKLDKILFTVVNVSDPDNWKKFFYAYSFCCFVQFLVKTLLLFLLVFLLNKAFLDKRDRYEWKEIAILLLPSVAGITVHLLRKEYEKILMEMGLDFYGAYDSIKVLLGIHYIITLVVILTIAFQFQNLRKKREEEKNRSLLQNQIQNMQSHIAETERIYTGIRGIRHDLNNHVHVISNLLEQKQYTEAEEYLETLRGTVDTFEFLIKTGNPVTDIIVNEKYREAEQKGIAFHSDFYFAQDANLNVFDISVILNNALENAFEAAASSKEAYVSLHAERKKNAYLITVKNSYEGKLHLGTDGLPESEKDNRDIHGFGLKNIKSVVEKYFGTFAIEQEESEVTLTIMLLIIL